MKIEPIEIDGNNLTDWQYGEIAFLLDREDFLKDLERARKKLGIKELLSENDDLDWTADKEKTIRRLLTKYRKSLNFRPILIDALMRGKVKGFETDSAYCTIINPKEVVSDYNNGIRIPELAIIITPETKLNDIEKLYKVQIPLMIKEYRRLFLNSKRKVPDTKPEIKRDREWYWTKKKTGLSYQKIWKKWENEHPEVEDKLSTSDTVYRAIKNYQERLAMEL